MLFRRQHGQAYPNRRTVFYNRILPSKTLTLNLSGNLDLKVGLREITAFVEALRTAASGSICNLILINLTAVTNITPAAALILSAEIFRTKQFAGRMKLRAAFPTAPHVLELLRDIGFFTKFSNPPQLGGAEPQKIYLHFFYDVSVLPHRAVEIVEIFTSVKNHVQQRLYESLIEVMKNADEWAYPVPGEYRFWWALAFRDNATGEIGYVFYDQGRTIPKTLPLKFPDKLQKIVHRVGGAGLIWRAMKKGSYSKTGQRNRGKGLPTLKAFIDGSKSGELLIASGPSRVIYTKDSPPDKTDFPFDLPGTLISWNFVADPLRHDPDDFHFPEK